MPIDSQITWGILFKSLELTPGMASKPAPSVSTPQILSELKGGQRQSSVDERMTLMAGLLAPFFCPVISWEDTFEIARAGESSPLMFKLFQERHQIAPALSLCKPLKAAPILELAHQGPKNLLQLLVAWFQGTDSSGYPEISSNLASYFSTSVASGRSAMIQIDLEGLHAAAQSSFDPLALVTSLPAWSLIDREANPYQWACRHDEIAVVMKNARLPGQATYQRQAATMIEDAITVFEAVKASKDAAIAKSNLGNLVSKAEWLTIDERFRRAMALYEAALTSAGEGEFHALLKDNIAGRIAEAAEFGLQRSSRKALEMSLAAAEELEAIGKTDRLPEVLSNVVLHIQSLRSDTDSRKDDLAKARQVARRAIDLLKASHDQSDSRELDNRLKQSLADVLVRSADYEPERREEFAAEALKLLDSMNE